VKQTPATPSVVVWCIADQTQLVVVVVFVVVLWTIHHCQ
jgi:hypothetical protein